MDALEKAPPENMSSNCRRPELVCLRKLISISASIPGSRIWDPKRYTAIKSTVVRILFLRSSIFEMFFKVSQFLITT
jgi:hypothetical protein